MLSHFTSKHVFSVCTSLEPRCCTFLLFPWKEWRHPSLPSLPALPLRHPSLAPPVSVAATFTRRSPDLFTGALAAPSLCPPLPPRARTVPSLAATPPSPALSLSETVSSPSLWLLSPPDLFSSALTPQGIRLDPVPGSICTCSAPDSLACLPASSGLAPRLPPWRLRSGASRASDLVTRLEPDSAHGSPSRAWHSTGPSPGAGAPPPFLLLCPPSAVRPALRELCTLESLSVRPS